MRLEDTPEYKLSMAMRPACDRVLCDVFGIQSDRIERFDKSHALFVLDKEHAIDMRVKLKNGAYLLGQEKALSNKFYKYRTFTIEFWQNRHAEPKEPGEFFKIAAQFYLHGYADLAQQNFVEWKVFDILRLMDWLKSCSIDKLSEKTRPAGGSRAAFLPVPYDKIPKEFVIAEWCKSAQIAA